MIDKGMDTHQTHEERSVASADRPKSEAHAAFEDTCGVDKSAPGRFVFKKTFDDLVGFGVQLPEIPRRRRAWIRHKLMPERMAWDREYQPVVADCFRYPHNIRIWRIRSFGSHAEPAAQHPHVRVYVRLS